jgi:hypothetical protein
VNYRSRDQWGAKFNVSTLPSIVLPRQLLFVHHNVIEPTDDPNNDMLVTENADIMRFGKPSYKWAVHPSGVVLEGTGTHRSPDTFGHNNDLSVMFMGNFEKDTPTQKALMAGRELVNTLKLFGVATVDVQIMGHRDVYPTACPGANLYPWIQLLHVPPPVVQSQEEHLKIIVDEARQYYCGGGRLVYSGVDLPATLPTIHISSAEFQAHWVKAYGTPF